MTKSFSAIVLLLLLSLPVFSQTKSFEDAREEIKSFTDFAAFSFSYDESKYLTIAEIKTEVLAEKDDLRKRFSKFEWQMTSLFAIKGIDRKPVSNLLCINSQSKAFEFSRENSLTLLFSDGDVMLGEPNRLSEVKRGKTSEKLCWEVDGTIFGDFARSEKIEFQLGLVKGRIRADKMQIFKDYAKLLEVETIKSSINGK